MLSFDDQFKPKRLTDVPLNNAEFWLGEFDYHLERHISDLKSLFSGFSLPKSHAEILLGCNPKGWHAESKAAEVRRESERKHKKAFEDFESGSYVPHPMEIFPEDVKAFKSPGFKENPKGFSRKLRRPNAKDIPKAFADPPKKRLQEGYLGRLFGQVPPEVAAMNHCWLIADHIRVKISNYYYPLQVRKLVTEFYNYYGWSIPREFTLGPERSLKPHPFRWGKDDRDLRRLTGGIPKPIMNNLKREFKLSPLLIKHYSAFNHTIWLQCQALGVREYLAHLEQSPGHSKLSESIDWYCFSSDVWDALRLSFDLCKITMSRDEKSEIFSFLLSSPLFFAELLKADATLARRRAFNQTQEKFKLFPQLEELTVKQWLQFSYLVRALPADPTRYKTYSLSAYCTNMCTVGITLPESTDVALDKWFSRCYPKQIKHLPFKIGTSACFEFTRTEGGLPKACSIYVAVGKQYARKNLTRAQELLPLVVEDRSSDDDFAQLYQRWRYLILGAYVTVWDMYQQDIVPPCLIIAADEKGLKTRFPTASIAPILILQHVLRSYMDQCLMNDERISPSIRPGNPLRNPIGKTGKFRSVDATTATDNHPFELSRKIYYRLIDRLIEETPKADFFKRIRRLVPFIFGPRALVLEREPSHLDNVIKRVGRNFFKIHQLSDNMMGVFKSAGFSEEFLLKPVEFDDPPDPIFSDLPEFIDTNKLLGYYRNVSNESRESGLHTKRGAMMGEPTSWPGLPLVTIMAWEDTVAPHRYGNLRTTGDDAECRVKDDIESELFTANLEARGEVVSEFKDFLHDHLSVYTEIISWNGKPIKDIFPISTIIGPFGASKGTINWFNMPSQTQAVLARTGAVAPMKVWRLTKFYPYWHYARWLGLPLTVPIPYGGIALPIPKFNHDFFMSLDGQRWGRFLSHTSSAEWVSKQKTLSLVRAPKFGESWKEHIERVSIKAAVDVIPRLMRALVLPKVTAGVIEACKALLIEQIHPLRESEDDTDDFEQEASAHLEGLLAPSKLNLLLKGNIPPFGEKVPNPIRVSEQFHRRLAGPIKGKIRNVGHLISTTDEHRARFINIRVRKQLLTVFPYKDLVPNDSQFINWKDLGI